MKVTSLKTYPYTQSASTERPSVEAPYLTNKLINIILLVVLITETRYM